MASRNGLTKEEMNDIAALVAAGIAPTAAAKQLHIDPLRLFNQRKKSKGFDKKLSDIITARVEENLGKIVNGELYLVREISGPVFEDGKMVLDQDGNPVLKVIKREANPVTPTQGHAELWLKAHKPEKYNQAQKVEVNRMGDDLDPTTILEKFKNQADPDPKE